MLGLVDDCCGDREPHHAIEQDGRCVRTEAIEQHDGETQREQLQRNQDDEPAQKGGERLGGSAAQTLALIGGESEGEGEQGCATERG